MAIGSTIYKAEIVLSNLDIHQYEDLKFTIAKHPSENESRMMYRILAFLYCSHQDLQFTKGLSTTDEPELWQKSHSGEIIQWIELGLPEPKRIRQASGKANLVKIFTYHQNKAKEWYQKNKSEFFRNKKLDIFHLEVVENGPIDRITSKSMQLSCLIEDQMIFLSNDIDRVGVRVEKSL